MRMSNILRIFLEWVARKTGIPVRVTLTILIGFGVFHAYNELGPAWAFGIWIPIWAMLMYLYRDESKGE